MYKITKTYLTSIADYGVINTISLLRNKLFNFNRFRIIQDAINKKQATLYLEIGVREGAIFRNLKGKQLIKIGVDPIIHPKMKNLKKGETLFNKTSDDFFETDAVKVFKDKRIDVAFIDGLHTFEQVIKDIFNVEKYMSKNGLIIIHDCNPFNESNENVNNQGKVRRWNGDVWKAGYYLIINRKDLKFKTLNCDNGLGMIYGFSDRHNINLDLSEVERIKKKSFSFLNKNRRKAIHLVSPFKIRAILENI